MCTQYRNCGVAAPSPVPVPMPMPNDSWMIAPDSHQRGSRVGRHVYASAIRHSRSRAFQSAGSRSGFGVTTPGLRWALAEGRVGGDDGAQTYILLSNPGSTAGVATLTFLRTDGTTLVKTVDVPAASRVTFGVTGPDGAAPELVDEAFGTLIESTQPIVVERSFYTNANGVIWAAGTNATATALPEPGAR
jgi:hypothetical protein